jgi:hypothetical protein
MTKAEENVPDLPEPEVVLKGQEFNVKLRYCVKCGKEARILSNQYGIQAFCDSCHIDWPISNPAIYQMDSPTPPRGIHKVTSIDYSYDINKLWGNK